MFSRLFDFKRHRIKCPDGTTKYVYKNIDDAFPLYIEGFSTKLSGDLEGWDEIRGSVKADYESKIQGLLFQLDELNQGIMFDFRASYLSFMADPCSNNIFFLGQVERIMVEQRQLRKMTVQIKALMTLAQTNPENSDLILKTFLNIADQMGGKAGIEAAKIEINSNRNTAAIWASGVNSQVSENIVDDLTQKNSDDYKQGQANES